MSDEIIVPPDPQQMPSMAELEAKMKAKLNQPMGSEYQRPSTGLMEAVQKKAQKEKEAMREILAKNPSPTLTEASQTPASGKEATTGYVRTAAPMPPAPNPAKIPKLPNVNKEHEPDNLTWSPTSVAHIVSTLDPVGDVNQFLAAASQQKGVAFGLVGKKRGTVCFIKMTPEGVLMMARPEEDPKAWANPGLGFDGDPPEASAPGESQVSDYTPNTRTTQGWPYLTGRKGQALEGKDLIKAADLFEEIDEHMVELLEGRYSRIKIEDIKDPKQKELVLQLLNTAAVLRGEPIQDDKKELPPTEGNVLVEETTVKEVDAVELSALSELAMDVAMLRKNRDSKSLEKIEDKLLNFLAEKLLLGVTEVTPIIYEAFINDVNDCLKD